MRKYIIGFIIGAVIASTTQVYGEAITLIGKDIKNEVEVSLLGKKLSKKAPLIDGTTYVPIREVTENLGLKADFINGEVVITHLSEIDSAIKKKKNEIESVNLDIAKNNELIATLNQQIIDEEGKTDYMTGLSPSELLEKRKEIGAQLETQLDQLKAEIADLEAQKAALEVAQ